MRRLIPLLLLHLLVVALTGYSQRSATLVYVVASKTIFIWGERVQVHATVRDRQGVVQNVPVTWSVIPSNAATIAADGTVTPLDFMSFVVQAQAPGITGDLTMQVIPKQIVVKPDSDSMTDGGTQKMRAEILDMNNSPVPSARLNWYVVNAAGYQSSDIPRATIDTAGSLHALVAGHLKVRANIHYEYNPYTLLDFDGAADVQVNPPETYRFTRAFVGEATRETSILSPSPSPLIPTSRGFAFIASLDGTGSGVVEWTPNGVHPIAIAGRSSANAGFPLIQASELASSHGTQLLYSELDIQGAMQISAGTTDYTQPLLVQNSPLFGGEGTGFSMSRNSIAAGGMKIFSVGYADTVTHTFVNALYRGYGRGLSEWIVNSLDGAPGFEGQPFSVVSCGIADDGTAWFVLSIGASGPNTNVLFRAELGTKAEKILAVGDSFQNERVTTLVPFEDPGGFGVSNGFFAANNGDLLLDIGTDKSTFLVRWNAADHWTTPDVLRSTSNGIFWYEPAVGALLNGPANGLILWNNSGANPILQLGDTSIDGSPVQQIYSATATEQGEVYALIRTASSPMLIVRILPNRSVVLKAGDTLPIGAVPVISTMLTGNASGNPAVIAGGRVGSIDRLKNDGGLQPLVRIGDTLPNGRDFAGVQITTALKQASSLPDGSVVFGSNGTANDGVFVWRNGALDWQVRLPISFGGTTVLNTPSAFSINSRGDWVAQFGGAGIYFIRDSRVQKVMAPSDVPANLTMTGAHYPVVDEAGNVSFELSSGGDNYVMQWDGSSSKIILKPGQVMPDGREVRSISTLLQATSTSLVTQITMADGQQTFAAYSSGAWQYPASRTDRTASGDFVNDGYSFGVNSRGDIGFAYAGNNYNTAIAVRIGNSFHYVQSTSDFTPDGALLTGISQIVMNDDGAMFVLGVNDQGQQVIYKATPEGPGVPYSVSNQGGTSLTATQETNSITTGFGSVLPANNGAAPAGLAIFQLRQNGVLVTEASVPMTQPVKSGRIYAEINSPVNTGLAIANPNTRHANVSFFFTDENGRDSSAGTVSISGGAQVAAFLDQLPFNGAAAFKGTLTFISDLPVGAIALRGLLNERSDFLITTLPVVPLSAAATGTQVMPYFADGSGWTTQILLVNPSDSAISGTVQFIDRGSDTAGGQPVNVRVNGQSAATFPYSIPPRSSRRIATSGGGILTTGSVRIIPSSGSGAPSVSNVFSYKPGAITVSEAGTPVVPAGHAFRMYAESSGKSGEPGSTQSGIAIANPSTGAVTVQLDLTNLAGSIIGSANLRVPANGEVATFLDQISGFGTLPAAFQGVVRLTSSSSAVSIVGLRARYNERGDFLITTTSPFDENDPPVSTTSIFPHFAVGGGYSTQFILLNNPPAPGKTGVIRFQSSSGIPLDLTLR
jgi:hypothetical protein